MRPAVGVTKPVSILMVVDFPAPLAEKAKNAPPSTRNRTIQRQ